MIWEILKQFLAAGIGTVAFSIMFLEPREYYGTCGTIGGLGWLIYWYGTGYLDWSLFAATLAATAFVVLASRICSSIRRCPATMFLMPVIFPLVPGIGIYRTVYYLMMDQPDMGSEFARQAVGAAMAIVLGIMFVFEIPQKLINRIFQRKKS